MKELESEGLIIRSVFPEEPTEGEYSLSELGKEIQPILKWIYKGGGIFENLIDESQD